MTNSPPPIEPQKTTFSVKSVLKVVLFFIGCFAIGGLIASTFFIYVPPDESVYIDYEPDINITVDVYHVKNISTFDPEFWDIKDGIYIGLEEPPMTAEKVLTRSVNYRLKDYLFTTEETGERFILRTVRDVCEKDANWFRVKPLSEDS